MKSGFVSIAGRPNVGKSTLLNHIVGQKISITSRKPQTTRHRIVGVKTASDYQIAFVDTPGLHNPGKKTMNRVINRTARNSLEGVDVQLMLISARGWHDDDELPLKLLQAQSAPVILVINKMDQLKRPEELLPLIDYCHRKHDFAAIVPTSATRAKNIDRLLAAIKALLPQAGLLFPEDQFTDKSMRFLAAELIREQIIRQLGQELPYQTAVEIENFEEDEKGQIHIAAVIWVEKTGQKVIVLGKGGRSIKRIGERSRQQMQTIFDSRVHLNLWVKVKTGWAENLTALKSLGYVDE